MTLLSTLAQLHSGGQTGADVAGVYVARLFGVPTGGWMPCGWRTLDGPRPEYATLYSMRESSSRDYAPRTHANAQGADLSIRIAADWCTAGEVCTLRAVLAAGQRPHDVTWTQGTPEPRPEQVRAAVDRIRAVRVEVGRPVRLNVAGNSTRSAPGIELAAKRFMFRLLTALDAAGGAPPCLVCGHAAALHSTGPCGRGETRCRCFMYAAA